MGPVNRVNPPETRQVKAPCARIVATRVPPPGVRRMASRIRPSITPTERPFNSPTRSRRAGSKATSPRMARSVIAAT